MCRVEVIRHVAVDGILYWTFLGLETSFVGFFLWPSVAAYIFLGLAACGFEPYRFAASFLMN